MNFGDALDLPLPHKATVRGTKRHSLLNDVVEHHSQQDTGSEAETTDNVNIPDMQYLVTQLSPFGRVYLILDQLTTLRTINHLETRFKSDHHITEAINPSLQLVRERLLHGIHNLGTLSKERADWTIFVEKLVKTFRFPSSKLVDEDETIWDVVTLVFLTKVQSYGFKLDERVLKSATDIVLSRCELTTDRFEALFSVFDRCRFEETT